MELVPGKRRNYRGRAAQKIRGGIENYINSFLPEEMTMSAETADESNLELDINSPSNLNILATPISEPIEEHDLNRRINDALENSFLSEREKTVLRLLFQLPRQDDGTPHIGEGVYDMAQRYMEETGDLFLGDVKVTYGKVGDIFDVTPERIGSIKADALRKLRHCGTKGIIDFASI
jgi:DNA-directed RNA polymerase sigma subunit (sigma70/sigma32)